MYKNLLVAVLSAVAGFLAGRVWRGGDDSVKAPSAVQAPSVVSQRRDDLPLPQETRSRPDDTVSFSTGTAKNPFVTVSEINAAAIAVQVSSYTAWVQSQPGYGIVVQGFIGRQAIINGEAVPVGGKVKGATVAAIRPSEQKVVFRQHGREFAKKLGETLAQPN
jgi:hypothetical protein